MRNFTTGNRIVFLLGAGFNVYAACEAGNPNTLSTGLPARYPLVCDLLNDCFNMGNLPSGKSIEDLFQDSIDNGDVKPLDTLYHMLMESDYYITPNLKPGRSHEENLYLRFLRDFSKAPLLTFNYDSLPEILLLAEQSWYPGDGYGVSVKVTHRKIRSGKHIVNRSLRPVLHLHGSLCVYTAKYDRIHQQGSDYPILQEKNNPDFLFDPDALGQLFFPFERATPGSNYKNISRRVIAPVPNKAEGLKDSFIKAVYCKAHEYIRNSSQIVIIGYSINDHDRSSYSPLLDAASNKSILIASPQADSLVERLTREHTRIKWESESLSFKEWVSKGYPGVKKDV